MIANPFDRIVGGAGGQLVCNANGSISVTLAAGQPFSLGAGFQDFAQIAAPADPAAGTRRLFTDSATGELSVRTAAGATVSLEGGGGASGANPTATIGLAAVNGAAATFLRSDGAPALAQTIDPTWTGQHTFAVAPIISVNTSTVASFDVLLNIKHSVVGTPLAGFGTSVRFGLESSTTLDRDAGAIVVTWTTATDATRTSRLSLQTVSAGGGLAEGLRLENGQVSVPGVLGVVSYSFSNDLDTGLSWRTANVFNLVAEGVDRIRISSIGNANVALAKTVSTTSDGVIGFTSSVNLDGAVIDTGISRVSALLFAMGNGAQGSFTASLKLTDLFTNNTTFLIRTNTTLTGGSTANAPTLTTGPVNGNPTKWLPIDDNGTTRFVPAW